MRAWRCLAWALVMGAFVGCGDNGKPPASDSPQECSGGVRCECEGGGRSITRCEDDASEVCDCACGDFTPTEPSADFEACGGNVQGGWELTDIDVSQLPGHDIVGGCPDVQIVAPTPPTMLAIFDSTTEVEAQVDRGGQTLELQLLRSCINPKSTCEQLPGGWIENGCGTCERELVVTGVIDKSATWSTSKSALRITHGDIRPNGQVLVDSYDYCVKGDTLTLKLPDLGIVYSLERRYFNGSAASCSPRSLEACEELDGCHAGSCRGLAECILLETQEDCETSTACTWNPGGCGGLPSKRCTIEDYGVDPTCTMSEAAP